MPRQRRGIRGDVGIAPYARLPHLHLALALSFRASAHTGVGIRSPFHINGGLGRHLPLPLRGKGAI